MRRVNERIARPRRGLDPSRSRVTRQRLRIAEQQGEYSEQWPRANGDSPRASGRVTCASVGEARMRQRCQGRSRRRVSDRLRPLDGMRAVAIAEFDAAEFASRDRAVVVMISIETTNVHAGSGSPSDEIPRRRWTDLTLAIGAGNPDLHSVRLDRTGVSNARRVDELRAGTRRRSTQQHQPHNHSKQDFITWANARAR
jgi:hypothetical protein